MSSVKNRQIIDSHCHVQFPQYDPDRDEVIRRARKHGIEMICVGTDQASSVRAVELAEQYEGLYASVGTHPSETSVIDATLAQRAKVVALGEIGLDYYHAHDKEVQKKLFEQQLELARNVRKPIIVHCRDAYDDMLAILRVANHHGVMHSFTGTVQQANEYMKLGYFIGLNAIITFADQYDDMVRSLPIERILLETDAPYLAPAPYRGKRNEPLYIEAVGNSIAKMRGIDAEELFSRTTENARRLFGI